MNGASKFIVNDYFIYMTIAISYNFNKGTELSNRLLRGRSAKKCLLVKLPMIAASRPKKSRRGLQ